MRAYENDSGSTKYYGPYYLKIGCFDAIVNGAKTDNNIVTRISVAHNTGSLANRLAF